MHEGHRVAEDVYWVGVDDHSTDLFEALWPLPKGISYNAYLVCGEKTALIDSVPAGFLPVMLEKIERVISRNRKIDYLIINHMEPDHSGSISLLRKVFPGITLVGNSKTRDLLRSYYGITDGITIVDEDDPLDLGGRGLQFILTPMVHWPETMMTYETTAWVLFSGDAFGGFGTVDEGLFDDQIAESRYADELLRYFSNIIGRYGAMVQNAITKVRDLAPGVVAPTHGLIWRKNPVRVVDLYERWNSHETEPGIVIAYASMYGNTRRAVETVARACVEHSVPVTVHNLSHSHASYVVRDIWRYNGCVLAGPTYNTGLFPLVADLLDRLENKLIPTRVVGILGSHGWASGAVKQLQDFAKRNTWHLVEPVVDFTGMADDATLKRCRTLAENLSAACDMRQSAVHNTKT